MGKHAVISPSALSRVLACPPSAQLERKFKIHNKEEESVFAQEGTVAHTLGELLIKRHYNLIDALTFKRTFERLKLIENTNGDRIYSEVMQDYCEAYRDYVIERYELAKAISPDALLFLETVLDLTAYIPQGFGTADVIILCDAYLEIIDLKYGVGVKVSANGNPQMKAYALGALKRYDYIFELPEVKFTIYQPRMNNIDRWAMNAETLKDWGVHTLIPVAREAFAGKGVMKAGKHCKFCAVKVTCRAYAEYCQELAQYDFIAPPLLAEDEIAEILDKANELSNWLADLKKYALEEAKKGVKFNGWKLVQGKSNRVIVDEAGAKEKLLKSGWAESVILTEPKLKGITQLEKAIGKKLFSLVLKDFIDKPEGAPILVPEDDEREELNNLQKATKEFAKQ